MIFILQVAEELFPSMSEATYHGWELHSFFLHENISMLMGFLKVHLETQKIQPQFVKPALTEHPFACVMGKGGSSTQGAA